MRQDGPRDWPASTPFCGNDTMNWRGNLMGDEREQPRAANPEPQLKPDSRLSRMADLAERKIQLEVELLELKVAQAKKDLETPMRVPCGARLSAPQHDKDCVCMLPLGHAEDYHLCKEGVGWS